MESVKPAEDIADEWDAEPAAAAPAEDIVDSWDASDDEDAKKPPQPGNLTVKK